MHRFCVCETVNFSSFFGLLCMGPGAVPLPLSLPPRLRTSTQIIPFIFSSLTPKKPHILTTQSQDNQCVIWRSVLLTHPFRECITCHSLAITCSTVFGKVYWVYIYSVSSRQRIIIENSYALCEVVICISVMFVYLVCQPCCGHGLQYPPILYPDPFHI